MTTKWSTALAMALLMATTGFSVWGETPPEAHYPITPRLVARALSSNGMQTADEQVTLPAEVVAKEAYPALDILSVEPMLNVGPDQARSIVKLACHLPTSCVPFFATVAGVQTATAPATPFVPRKTNPAITMRAGTHAILLMDDQVTHIQVAVVSMENGAAGKWIRVASPDHKQFYRGEVVSANQLRGEF